MQTLWQDLRHGARMLLKNPGFALVDALALLKVAVELHPNSAPLHDALGDVYQQKGQKESARQAYEKAVEVDPNFEHAKEMLKKLTP